MNHKHTLPVQDLIRISEHLMKFIETNKGLPHEECEAVLFYAVNSYGTSSRIVSNVITNTTL